MKGRKKCADGGQPGPKVQSEYEANSGMNKRRAPGGGGGPKGAGSGKPMRKNAGMTNTNLRGYSNGGKVKKK